MIHDTIKQRLRASLLLTPPPKATHASALRLAASLREDGVWDDLPSPASALSPTGKPLHLDRTLLLAKAHRAAAGTLDDPLRHAFDFWLANDFSSPDWRQRQITIPRLIGEIALLYDNGLSAGAAGKVMEILARSRWASWVAPVGWVDRVGMDLLGIAYNQLLRGCLENAPSFFDAAFGRIFREIRLVQPGEEGIQADMTFRASTQEPSGGGLGFMRECAQFIALAHGTPWQAPAETVRLFVGFLLDAQQWMMRQETVDAESPDDVCTERGDLAGIAAVVQQLAQLGNPPRRLELAAYAHRLQGRGEALSGHRYFWRARMAVHQRPAFYASLRLSSSPLADGRMVFLRSSREYHGLGTVGAAAATPGGTRFAGAAGSAPGHGTVHHADLTPALSGDVSEGDCGLAVTELQRPGLNGKKAWFFFDESVVCLGVDLQGVDGDDPVRTTINHCRAQGPALARMVGGETRQLAPGQEHSLRSVRMVEHDGISYVFPDPAAVVVRSGLVVTEPDGSDPAATPAFSLQLDHGARPRGASWAYLVIPGGEEPDDSQRVADEVSRVEILANTSSMQAVRHRGLGLLGVAFWVPGVVMLPGGGRVAANHPCLLLCRDDPGGGTRLSISNPSGQAAAVHVEYGGQCVRFELPGGPDAGRSVSRLL